MKIQITQDKFDSLSNKHLEWFENYINRREKRLAKKNPNGRLKINDILGKLSLGTFRDLITAKGKDCLKYIAKYQGMKLTPQENKKWLDFFGYDIWSKEKSDWNAYKFIQELGIRVCPYCNRNNIDYSEIKRDKMIPRAPFDHFFPKDKYPYLSCSLFNLIPCCYTCNSAKSNKDTSTKKIVYPYEEEFGEEGKFILADNGKEFDEEAKDIKKEIVKNFIVKLQSKGSLKNNINEANETFYLSGLYSQEHNFIYDLLEKIDMYSEILDRTKLLGIVEKMFFTLFFNLPENSNKIYSYQKVTMDIIEQSKPDLKKYFPRLANS
jgi:hypothetical protein